MEEDALHAGAQRRTRVSWGAVFAGLVFIIGVSWLLAVLGVALGMSIADAGELDIMGRGFALSTGLWVLVSTLVVLFLGSLVTARLAGQAGALHGITLWSSLLTLMFVLGAAGAAGVFGTGLSLMRTGAVATQGVVSGAATSFHIAQAYWADIVDSPVMNAVQSAIRRETMEVLARSQTESGPEVTPGELERAAGQIDDVTLRAVATALLRGNPEQAQSVLAARTNLTQDEIESVVQGVRETVQQQAAEIEESVLVERIERQLQAQLDQIVTEVSRMSGPEVRREDIERALAQLDTETLATTARYLVLGLPERAKHTLAVNTALTDEEIDSIVEGVAQETEAQIAKAVETASTYIQAVLWIMVLTAALGLLACIIGGAVGAPRARRA